MSLPNHITYKPFLGPWHFSYTPFVVPPPAPVAFFLFFSLSHTDGLSRASLPPLTPPFHHQQHVELSLRQRRLMWQVAALVEWGWEAARPSYESDTALGEAHSRSPLPFLFFPFLFTHLPFRSGTTRMAIFPSTLLSHGCNVKRNVAEALLVWPGCLEFEAAQMCEIEDGPAFFAARVM